MFALRSTIWLATAALISFQLFVPPIIGLSDQGDFPRVIGRFGYSRAEKDVPISEGYLSRKFVPDPHSRYPYLEQPTSEYIFVAAALGLNKIFSRDGSLDLTIIGAIHAIAFLAAFWWLLRAIELFCTGPPVGPRLLDSTASAGKATDASQPLAPSVGPRLRDSTASAGKATDASQPLAPSVGPRLRDSTALAPGKATDASQPLAPSVGPRLRGSTALAVATCILAAFIFTDVGYVAYWNSFYSEPASAIFFLALFAESLAICARGPARSSLIRWSIFAALFIIAKPQNFAFAVVLAPLALLLGWRAKAKFLAFTAAVALAAAGIFAIATFPPSNIWATAYNQIFLVILPNSPNPAADLADLGIHPKYADYSGTGAWTPRSAIQELVGNGVIGKRVTPATVGFFYLRHPLRMLQRARSFLPIAFSLRPEWCGNFELGAHRGHGAKATSFTLWSSFHERVLSKLGPAILIALLLAPFIALALWFTIPNSRLPIEFAAALAIGALLAFGVAAYGDAWDNVKHCFLFNLELDACLLAALCAISARFSRRAAQIALPMLALALCSACHPQSSWYPVPNQEPAFDDRPSRAGRAVAMDDPDADRRIVRDIGASAGTSWRWVLQRPAVKIRVHSNRLKYTIDFAVAGATIRDTGPVTLSFLVNDHVLERVRYDTEGIRHFEKDVPPDWIKLGEDNIVGAEIDKLWFSPDKHPYGFILVRMGLI